MSRFYHEPSRRRGNGPATLPFRSPPTPDSHAIPAIQDEAAALTTQLVGWSSTLDQQLAGADPPCRRLKVSRNIDAGIDADLHPAERDAPGDPGEWITGEATSDERDEEFGIAVRPSGELVRLLPRDKIRRPRAARRACRDRSSPLSHLPDWSLPDQPSVPNWPESSFGMGCARRTAKTTIRDAICPSVAADEAESRRQNVGSPCRFGGNAAESADARAPCSMKSGAPGWNRTSDTRFRKPVLYPLSYEGIVPICRGFSSATAGPEYQSCEKVAKSAGNVAAMRLEPDARARRQNRTTGPITRLLA